MMHVTRYADNLLIYVYRQVKEIKSAEKIRKVTKRAVRSVHGPFYLKPQEPDDEI